jgi:hypothetical protein
VFRRRADMTEITGGIPEDLARLASIHLSGLADGAA